MKAQGQGSFIALLLLDLMVVERRIVRETHQLRMAIIRVAVKLLVSVQVSITNHCSVNHISLLLQTLFPGLVVKAQGQKTLMTLPLLETMLVERKLRVLTLCWKAVTPPW